MSQTSYSRYKYTPDEMSESEFLSRFVVRNEEFDEIFEYIKHVDYRVPCQHYIITGQRGQGKTTLLRKLMLEAIKDNELSKFLIPVKFTEEQYQIRSLCRLWEEVAGYLQDFHGDEFEGVLDKMEEHFENDGYDTLCFPYLESVLKSKNKKLLLLIDNIDELLGKLKDKEQRYLREILLTSSSFIIIGGSTRMLEQHFDYGKPFFEFFKVLKLQGLNKEESVRFLSAIGKGEQKDIVKAVIKNSPERIESLRQLTGGVPRTLVMLFDIFIDEKGNAFEDLLKILDEATPLYKHRMDDLPPVLQDIVHTLALNWDGMYTREISKKVRLESKVVSAQLKQLEKYEFVTSESVGKNKIYKIQERFFNIWYLMRFGRKKDRKKVEWLVKFLVCWYNQDELKMKAGIFLEAIKKGDIHESYAYHMCEALCYTGGLDMETDYEVKETAKEYLVSIDSELAEDVSKSDVEIIKNAFALVEEEKVNEAIKYLLKYEKSTKEIQVALATLFHRVKDYASAEYYYIKASKNGDIPSLNTLGLLYSAQGKNSDAESFFRKAISNEDKNALCNLALLYAKQGEYTVAEEFCIEAIENGDSNALYGLGLIYENQGKYTAAEECYLNVIKDGSDKSLNNLSCLYFEQAIKSEKSIELASRSYKLEKNYLNTHVLSVVLLWGNDFSKSYELFIEWMNYGNEILEQNDIVLYLSLLIAKKQLYKAKEFMELPEYHLKDKLKPIWYALMTLMQDDFPDELKKMGGELTENVGEVLGEITRLSEKYSSK